MYVEMSVLHRDATDFPRSLVCLLVLLVFKVRGTEGIGKVIFGRKSIEELVFPTFMCVILPKDKAR